MQGSAQGNRQGEFSRRIREVGVPNNSRFWFVTIDLPNLVYNWYNIYNTFVKFRFHRFFDLFAKIRLEVWAAVFERKSSFVRTCHFCLFSAEPLYQNVRIDHMIIYTFSYQEGGPQGNRQYLIQKQSEIRIWDQFRFLGFYIMFIKIGLMGWI